MSHWTDSIEVIRERNRKDEVRRISRSIRTARRQRWDALWEFMHERIEGEPWRHTIGMKKDVEAKIVDVVNIVHGLVRREFNEL